MKKNLGRFLFIFLTLLHVQSFASTYEWSVTSSKKSAFKNEAIHLKYVCSFSDASALYTIDFNPTRKTKEYTLKLLTQSDKIVNNKRQSSYEFVAFAHEEGIIPFEFEAIMKKTNQDSIKATILGRDNAQEANFTNTVVKLKALNIEIKETPIELVGAFTLEVKKEKPYVKAYQPYHIEIYIKGSGNFDALKPFEFVIDGVKVFSQKIIQKTELTQDGVSGSWSQKFAFVSAHDFKLQKISLRYFDTHEKALKELTHEHIEVHVEKGFAKEELLEKSQEKANPFYNYINYILTFIAGFLLGKIKIKRKLVSHTKGEKFSQKIKEAKSLEELVMILAIEDSVKYQKLIYEIESKNVTSLSDIKKSLKV